MSHCRSSTVVSISDTLVSELVTLSTNSLYCKSRGGITVTSPVIIVAVSGFLQFTEVNSLSYLHRHLVVFALQEGGQVPQSKVVLQHSDICTDHVRLTVIFTCC